MNDSRNAPLTAIQQGMVLRHLRGDAHDLNVEQLVCESSERVDRTALRKAVRWLAQRHDALRSHVDVGNDPPRLAIVDDVPLDVEWMDLTGLSPSAAAASVRTGLHRDRQRPFDLAGPLIRFTGFELPDDTWTLVVTLHHVIADGRSHVTLLTDLFDAYDAFVNGHDAPTRSVVSADALYDWHATRDWTSGKAFWSDVLQNVEHATSVAPRASFVAGAQRTEVTRELDSELDGRVRLLASVLDVTVNTVVQTAWGVLLGKLFGESSVTFGNTRAGRAGTVTNADEMVGTFIATVPVHLALEGRSVEQLLREVRRQQLASRPFEHVPLIEIQQLTSIPGSAQPFDSLVIFDRFDLNDSILQARPAWSGRHSFRLRERTPFPVTLYGFGEPRLRLLLSAEPSALSEHEASSWLDRLITVLQAMVENASRPVQSIEPLHVRELELLASVNDTRCTCPQEPVTAQFARQVERHPDRVAVEAGGSSCTYAQLAREADAIAANLLRVGVEPGDVVGIAIPRSVEMVAAVWGVLQAGAAYLPLDPEYPESRLRFCVDDAEVKAVIVSGQTAGLFQGVGAYEVDDLRVPVDSSNERVNGPHGDDLAYLIYTSGSTGQPKGVMVTHGNLTNFIEAMDGVVPHDQPGRWLAVTSLSFDIAVLELLWTLTRGFTVVLHGVAPRVAPVASRPSCSLFFFGSGGDTRQEDAYRLVLEAARFGDENGFEAVWTPERHFHAFGGHFPNPAVLGAAIAATTKNIHIRAGSVVVPLHSPLRVAEEWAVVDNLSNGRVGISVASGWQPNDFVLAPDRYERRRDLVFEEIETIRSLWRGESVEMKNPLGDSVAVRTHPRPCQETLPIWVTAAGNPETYRRAGELGANLLTHLLGQTVTEVAEKIRVYRDAYAQSGAPGRGHVTLMLHSFLGESRDAVREMVRTPLINYLRSAASLVGHYADAWTAYKRGAGRALDRKAMTDLSEDEREELLEFAFERYFETSGLFGTPDEGAAMLARVGDADVDEVGCLIDFGVPTELVLEHLPHIAEAQRRRTASLSIPEIIERHGITHMQCTPSAMKMILADVETTDQLASLQHVYLGGEALDAATVARVREHSSATITNMYGPTETTVWSTCARIGEGSDPLPIGRPIANTQVFVTDASGYLVPPGSPGELRIGGAGVTKGYLKRPELTAEKFTTLPSDPAAGVSYRTGDVVRMRDDGALEYLGRMDDQVKLGGHRIELGEIASALQEHEYVREAVAVVRHDGPTGADLVAYVVPHATNGNHPSALMAFLRERLPLSMLPSTIHQVTAFPLTPNNKIDRKALPSPWTAVRREAASVLPAVKNDVQATIAHIWEDVLNRQGIDHDASFFDLGGHSLLALEVQRRLEKHFARRVPVTILFRHPTISSLATHFASEPASAESGGTARAAQRRAARRRARGS